MSTPSGSDMLHAAEIAAWRRDHPDECRACRGPVVPAYDDYPRDWCPRCGSTTHLLPEHYWQVFEATGLCPRCMERERAGERGM